MADVVITLKIMPEGPDVDLKVIEEKASSFIKDFGGEVGKVEEEKVAFGITALKIIFVMDESKGSTENVEKQISEIEKVVSVEVTDVRRAIG